MSETQGKTSPPARLVIVDDHPLAREGMRSMLKGEPDLEVTAEAADGQEALELCRHLRPDLVLMDVRMPKMDGLEATWAIKEECSATSVLMVTSFENLDYLSEAVRAGAAGYVLKCADKQELLGAIRRVLKGEFPLDQELVMRLLQRLLAGGADRRQTQPIPPSKATAEEERQEPPPESLTELMSPRELEVLRLLAVGKTNQQIAQQLLLSFSTVKAHVQRIILKMGVSDRTQAAVRAIEFGLLPESNSSRGS